MVSTSKPLAINLEHGVTQTVEAGFGHVMAQQQAPAIWEIVMGFLRDFSQKTLFCFKWN